MAVNQERQNARDGVPDAKTTKALNKILISFRTTWKESEIQRTMAKMDRLKNQLVLRMLVALDEKADQDAARHKKHEAILKENKSDLVEILAIYQQQTQATLRQETGRILDRLESTQEAVAAVLTLRNGETKVVRFPKQDLSATQIPGYVMAEEYVQSSDQTMIRMRSSGLGDSPEAVVRKVDPFAVQTAILHSLTFRQIHDRFDMVHSPYRRTYDWVFRDPKAEHKLWSNFPQWLSNDSDTDTCYWINGKAGSGKSTLMKYISRDPRLNKGLSRWSRQHRLLVASFFFRTIGSDLQKSQEGLLRSILFEVFSRDPQLMHTVMHELCFLMAGEPDGTIIDPPSLGELQKWMHRLLSDDSSIRYCFIVDGIDEYDGDPAAIVDLISSLSGSKLAKFILSSRPLPVCVDGFADLPQLRLQDLTQDDIRQYAEGQLMPRLQKRSFTTADCGQIVGQIVAKSCGVFIWVVLSVKSLLRGLENRDRLDELQTRLEELPPDLADLYSHMMMQMSPSYQTQAAHFFRLAMMTLDSSTQQRECPFLTIQASFADEKLDYLGKPVTELSEEAERFRCEEIEGRIRSRCCGLLETRRALPSEKVLLSFTRYEYPCIDFLHRTVIEFLSDETIMKGIVEQCEADFSPPVTLFHSCVQTCKVLPFEANVTNSTSPMWQMMRRALAFASRADDMHTPIPRSYLQELDITVSKHWQATELFSGFETTGHWGKKLRFIDVAEGMHGKDSEWLLQETLGPVEFHCVAIAHSLPAYFSGDTAQLPTEATIQRDTILLFRAVGVFLRWPWHGHHAPPRYGRSIDICEALIKQGADPNRSVWAITGGSQGSVWSQLLSYAASPSSLKRAASRVSNGLYDGIGGNFARGFVRLVIALVSHGADVNHEISHTGTPGSPRLALSILEKYFSSIAALAYLGPESDALSSDEAPEASLLVKLNQGALDLMGSKGARRDEMSDQQRLNTTTEATLVPSTSSRKDAKLVRRFTNKMRALIK